MNVWGVKSTVIKHSDYFVWKDMSERVTRRCDDTIDKKRVNSCVLKYLFWREFNNQKFAQKSRKYFLQRGTMSRFQNFVIISRSFNQFVDLN